MKELDKFLSTLTDHELAIFSAYRYNTFLEHSRQKITLEIKRRQLSREQLDEYFKLKLPTNESTQQRSCPRCGSNNFITETDYHEKPVSEFSSAEIATDTRRCRICGLNTDKIPPKNLFDRIIRVFSNNKSHRVERWNEI